MSTGILIIGESGTGKSTAIETLNPKETFIISILNKPLPFKGWRKKYTTIDSEKNPKGNYYSIAKSDCVVKTMNYINMKMPHIKTIIIDDFQYIMSNEFMDRALEKGYDKFSEIGKHAWDVITTALMLRLNLNVIFLSHSDTDDSGKIKCKTIGKLLDEKVCVEGMFTIVFNSIIKDGQYGFLTQNLGNNIAKSPKGMFEDVFIPNDLQFVVDQINAYYDEDIEMDEPKPAKSKEPKKEENNAKRTA